METHLITSEGLPFMLINNAGAPVTIEQAQIDPQTIIDKLQIGTHISWKISRCVGDGYGLSDYSDSSGIVVDIGPKHFYVLTDGYMNNHKCLMNHYLRGYRLDSVACMDIEFIHDNDPRSLFICADINTAIPFKYAHHYNEYSQYKDFNTTVVHKEYRNFTYEFIEEGTYFDYFIARDLYYKPILVHPFYKTNRPNFLNLTPFKTNIEKYFETQ